MARDAAKGHFPKESAALKTLCLMTRSLLQGHQTGTTSHPVEILAAGLWWAYFPTR